jgi:hypothetical protein
MQTACSDHLSIRLRISSTCQTRAPLCNLLLCCATAVSRVALVKPEKARNVENMILAAAQRGQLMERVSSLVHLPATLVVPSAMRAAAVSTVAARQTCDHARQYCMVHQCSTVLSQEVATGIRWHGHCLVSNTTLNAVSLPLTCTEVLSTCALLPERSCAPKFVSDPCCRCQRSAW